MAFHDQAIVQKVRKERKKGTSIPKLGAIFGISESSISRWVRDIPSHSKKFTNARQRENELKLELQYLNDSLKIDKNLAKIFVSLLYWCEGSKHPAGSVLAFCNSDWRLVKTFLEFLRMGFKIKEENLRVLLQLHSTHPQKKITKFWSDLLQIPVHQFYKPTITNPTRSMKRLDYKGTCTIKYFDFKLLLNIIGLYENLASRYENDHGEVAEGPKAAVC